MLLLAAMACLLIVPARGDDAAAEREVRAALAQWTEDFNAGRVEAACDLFTRDLVSNYRGQPERGYEKQCDLLRTAIGDKTKTFHYALRIKEVLVAGDMAVVRLVWTLTITPKDGGAPIVGDEPGLDVFRRQPDGKWRIVRYMAFDGP